ncbi:hypothetical protein WJU17_00630 [Iodidimonas sp. SYSU 1G8]
MWKTETLRRYGGAARQDDGARNVQIGARAQHDVAISSGQRRRGVQVDVVPGIDEHAAIGRGDGGVHVNVTPAADHQIAVGGRDRGIDVDVALGVQGQGGGIGAARPCDRLVDVNIAIAGNVGVEVRRVRRSRNDNIATRHGADDDAVGVQEGRQHGARDVAAKANGEILRVDQPGACHAIRRQGRHRHIIGDHDICRRGLDEAAIAAVRRAGIEGAADVHDAIVHAAKQQDGAVAGADAARLDDAGVVDHRLEQLASGLRGHDDLAAIGADNAAILDQRVDGALVHRDVEQPVRGDVESDRLTRDERDGAQFRDDQAFVRYGGAQQRDVATIGIDHALIAHGAALAGELMASGHEIGVADIERGGHQPADIDLRPDAEQHAVGVDEEDFAVG